MMNIFAKLAMALSLVYYTLVLTYLWVGQLLGIHNEIWDAYDFPIQEVPPPAWTLIIGVLVICFGVGSLAHAYRGAWIILDGGPSQDFRDLAKNLQRIAWGLLGFWIFYNIELAGMPYLISIGIRDLEGFYFGWDPLDINIIFAIIAIVLLAMAGTLERAWLAEDETKHFL